jgi:excinuclease UvrABC nuclease subunit
VPNYKLYRKYKIDAKIDIKSGDDYSALMELITRRFKDTQNLPDLFIID